MTHPTQRGTVRRIRALIARGWPLRALAAELGLPLSVVHGISFNVHLVRPEVRAAIAELYEREKASLPPTTNRRAARATMARAHRNGWAPPHHWDDIDHDLHPRGRTEAVAS